MLRESLKRVPKSNLLGNTESSRGSFIKVVSTSTVKEKVMLRASRRSKRRAGIGKIMALNITIKAIIIHPSLNIDYNILYYDWREIDGT